MNRVRVLALSPMPEEGAGCRFRISQYVPYLELQGFDVTIHPFYSPEFFALVYEPGRYLKKTALMIERTIDRLRALVAPGGYDLVFVYREAFPVGPPLIELALATFSRAPIVFDFDDSIFMPNTSEANRIVSVVKWPSKVATIIKKSRHVVAGNNYLAEYASRFNSSVSVIPTCVDTDKFVPTSSPQAGTRPVVGWIGTPTTSPYILSLVPALQRAASTSDFTLRLSGRGRDVSAPGLTVENVRWTLADEVRLFNTCDIGVYPTPDDRWGKGKCGFKAIQFMACEVPVVASPVGVNKEIIQDGVNGFLASSEDEWVEKLGRLLSDPELRRRFGQAGRHTVEERYSLRVNAPKLASTFRQVLQHQDE